MAFSNELTINTKTFSKVSNADDRWIDTATTIDEPSYLRISSDAKESGASSFLVQRRVSKNNALTGADDVLTVHTVIRGPVGAFTAAEMLAAESDVSAFINSTGVIDRLRRGES